MFSKIRFFIPLAVVVTCLAGLIYVAAQQSLRMSANDPQIQMAQDAANFLKSNSVPDLPVVNSTRFDFGKSLAPFLIQYNKGGDLVNSTAQLGGDVPDLPKGILDYAKANGEDRLTWQPDDGTRIAGVIVYFHGKNEGYILAGRNLREVEKRENQLELQVFLGWVVTLAAAFLATLFFVPSPRKK